MEQMFRLAGPLGRAVRTRAGPRSSAKPDAKPLERGPPARGVS